MKWRKAEKKDENTFKIPERWVLFHYYEAFNLLFRIENALRVFVYIVLKNESKDKWVEVQVMSEDANEGTISSIAKKRMSQSKSFGYLGESVSCPIMHLTSGELTRLITSDTQWKLFKNHFSGSRDIMRNKLEEIGAIRNSLAHFRPIKVEDVEVLSQNSRHVLVGIEELFAQVLQQKDVVPTNSESMWYKELRTLGTEECKLSFHQSVDERWLRILLTYDCPIANYNDKVWWGINYQVLNLRSSAIISLYPVLRENIIYLSERVPYVTMPDNHIPPFRKDIALVCSRRTMEEQYSTIKDDIARMLGKISEEVALIRQDNLARGELIQSVDIRASQEERTKGGGYWEVKYGRLRTPVLESDPQEYWGGLGFFAEEDFIAGTNEYPWMPQVISEIELPF